MNKIIQRGQRHIKQALTQWLHRHSKTIRGALASSNALLITHKQEQAMSDDFCIEHGYEFMTCDKIWGAIPYCRKCAESGPAEDIEAIRDDLREIINAPAPQPVLREVTTKYGVTFKIRDR